VCGDAPQAYTPPPQEGTELVNVLNIILLKSEMGHGAEAESAFITEFAAFLQSHSDLLRSLAIRRVTLVISREQEFPDHYTFRYLTITPSPRAPSG